MMKIKTHFVFVILIAFIFALGVIAPTAAQSGSDSAEPTESVTAEPTEMVTAEPTEMVAAEPTEMVTSEPGAAKITIIIEGPVQSINVNIITIYDMEVEVDDHDPILTQIHTGDFVRVEGDVVNGTSVILIVPVTIYVVNANVIVTNGGAVVWQDDGSNCKNAPPPWAPANGWRRRCSPPIITIPSGGNGNGHKGRDNEDD